MTQAMPPYLATCHVLAHLETPIAPADFQRAMHTNPFFRQDCVHAELFLKHLCEMGLLQHGSAGYGLTEQGKQFENHILQWNRHDPKVKQARQQRAQNPQAEAPLPTHCPACGNQYCALYIFVLLYTRFVWGNSPVGADALAGTARDYLSHLEIPFHHYYLWDQRLHQRDCTFEELQFLQVQLPSGVWQAMAALLNESRNLMGFLGALGPEKRLVLPYYQYLYRVLPASLLQQVQALRFPDLARYLDPHAPEGMGLVHLGPWLRDPQSQDVWAVVRCNHLLQVHQWALQPGTPFQLVRVHKACYTEQRKID